MESKQSTSKKVNFGNKRVKWGDPDYEEQLLKWLEELEKKKKKSYETEFAKFWEKCQSKILK